MISTMVTTLEAQNMQAQNTLSQTLQVKQETYESLFHSHAETLKYLDVSNPRLLVMFSGTPGMGKTTVAKFLEDKFKAIRLSTDESRQLLSRFGLSISLADEYVEWCLEKIRTTYPNQMVILDRSIDRTFATYQRFASSHHYDTFIIKMSVPRPLVEERIRRRERHDTEKILEGQDRSWRDYELFNVMQKCDAIFVNIEDIQQNLQELIPCITEKKKKKMPFLGLEPGMPEYEAMRSYVIASVYTDFEMPSSGNYHEILPGLYLGNQSAAADENLLEKVSDVITLRSIPGRPEALHVAWKGISVVDNSEGIISDHFDKTFECINNTSEAILVHCREGISRSPTIVIAFLMRKFDLPYHVACEFVRRKRAIIQPNLSFQAQLKQFELKLLEQKHVCLLAH